MQTVQLNLALSHAAFQSPRAESLQTEIPASSNPPAKNPKPRHPGRHPHIAGYRAGATIRHRRRAAGARPVFAAFGPVPCRSSQPGHRPLQGRRLASPGRRAEILLSPEEYDRPNAPPSTPSIPPRCDRCHAPGSRAAGRSCKLPGAGARLRHRQFHGRPPKACDSSASSSTPSRPHRPGDLSWSRHSGREFQRSRLPEDGIDAVIGNVPFADLKLDYQGQKLALLISSRQIGRCLKARRRTGAGHEPFRARQTERVFARISSAPRPTS